MDTDSRPGRWLLWTVILGQLPLEDMTLLAAEIEASLLPWL